MRVSYGVWLLGAAIVVPFVACTSFGSSGDDPADGASSSSTPSATSRVEPTGTSPGPTSTGPLPTGSTSASSSASTTPPTGNPCLDRDAGPGIPRCGDAGAPSSVACGAQTCRDSTRVCCITNGVSRDCQNGCSGDGVVMMCDDRDDCPANMVCCAEPPAGAGFVGSSSCQAFCDSASLTLCTDATQCRSGVCGGVGPYKRCM